MDPGFTLEKNGGTGVSPIQAGEEARLSTKNAG